MTQTKQQVFALTTEPNNDLDKRKNTVFALAKVADQKKTQQTYTNTLISQNGLYPQATGLARTGFTG